MFDMAIIGAGPAGYTASIYASRYKLSNIVLGELPGGLITGAHKVCNFPGMPDVSGMDLGFKFQEHARSLGGEEYMCRVSRIDKNEDGLFEISTFDSKKFVARTVLLATGCERKKLSLPHEQELTGKGVSYCAVCDAPFYKRKVVGVVGGGDTANTASLLLAENADKVYQIYRGTELKGERAWVDQVLAHPKIEVLYNTNVTELDGATGRLASVTIQDEKKSTETLSLDGLFVEIGSSPNTTLAEQLKVARDEGGYIVTGTDQSTSIEGIYAAGDITTGSNGFRQVITACSEGSIAAQSIYRYLTAKK